MTLINDLMLESLEKPICSFDSYHISSFHIDRTNLILIVVNIMLELIILSLLFCNQSHIQWEHIVCIVIQKINIVKFFFHHIWNELSCLSSERAILLKANQKHHLLHLLHLQYAWTLHHTLDGSSYCLTKYLLSWVVVSWIRFLWSVQITTSHL